MKKMYFTVGLCAVMLACSCEKDVQEEIFDQESVSIKDKTTSVVSGGNNNSISASGITGDGKTDNRKTLQTLINQAADKKQVLILPAGKFMVSDELILPSDVTLQGQGANTELILSAGSASGRNVLRIPTRMKNISIRNLKINANQSQNSGTKLVSFYVTDNTENIAAENVIFAGGKESGSVQVKGLNDYPVKNIKFINCQFSEAGRTALELRGTRNALVSNSTFLNWGTENAESPALQLQSQNNIEIIITNNIFSNSVGKLYAIESTASTTDKGKIENNVFNDAKSIGGNGVGGTFNATSIVNNKFGGGKGLQRAGLNIKGNGNVTTPNTFSETAFPVNITTPAPGPGASGPAPAPAAPSAPAPQPSAPVNNNANATGLNGNGVTDNRNTLQKLVDTYASRRQTLVLPAGKFAISNEIILPSNLSIEGAGDATEIILMPGSGSNRKVFRIPTRMNNISIKNMKLNANFGSNTGAHLAAFHVTDNTKDITCNNVSFLGGRDGGVVLVKGLVGYPIVNINISNCRISDGGRTSLEVRGTKDPVFANNHFTRWGLVTTASPSLQLQSVENINVQIINNTFDNTNGKQFAIECAAAYTSNSKISNNKLNDSKGLGGNGISGYFRNTVFSGNVHGGGIGTHRSGYEVFGSGNTITQNTIEAGAIAISPGFTEDGTNVVISKNTVKTRGANVGGVQLGGGKYNLRNIKIQGNTIDTRASSGNSSAIVLGTYNATRAISDVTIEDNTIYTNAHCIRVQALSGSKNVYVYRNHFKSGFSWLGVITNTVSNIVSEGNVNELANKSATYSK